MKLRIATFNLENLDETDRSPTLEERIEVLRPFLFRVDADILCLQEVHGQERDGEPRRLLALEQLFADTQYADFEFVHTKTSNDEAYDKRNLVIVSRFTLSNVAQYRNDLVPAASYKRVTAQPPDDEAKDVIFERPMLYARAEVTPGRFVHVINLHLKSRQPSSVTGQQINRYAWRSAPGWAEGYFISSMKRVGAALETRILIDQLFDDDRSALIAVCGDFNARPGEVPVEAICGKVENTGNPGLVWRELVPCEHTIPESSRYTFLHHGKKRLLDHMLISQCLLSYYRHAEIHNEALHDETIAYTSERVFPGSDHAPFVAEFEV